MAGCKTAARNNEPGVPVGNGHGEAARHRHALERIQCAGYGGPEVKSRISRMGVLVSFKFVTLLFNPMAYGSPACTRRSSVSTSSWAAQERPLYR